MVRWRAPGNSHKHMKQPEKMTRAELVEYVHNLKKMIHGLQATLTKALEKVEKAKTP